MNDEETTYLIRRFTFDQNHPEWHAVIAEGLSLEEAQEHCKRDDTHGEGWFDGYEAES